MEFKDTKENIERLYQRAVEEKKVLMCSGNWDGTSNDRNIYKDVLGGIALMWQVRPSRMIVAKNVIDNLYELHGERKMWLETMSYLFSFKGERYGVTTSEFLPDDVALLYNVDYYYDDEMDELCKYEWVSMIRTRIKEKQ